MKIQYSLRTLLIFVLVLGLISAGVYRVIHLLDPYDVEIVRYDVPKHGFRACDHP